jgi:predicted nucleic acid-binding protein
VNVLVDTSVWVGHFKQRDDRLAALLDAGLDPEERTDLVVDPGQTPRRDGG